MAVLGPPRVVFQDSCFHWLRVPLKKLGLLYQYHRRHWSGSSGGSGIFVTGGSHNSLGPLTAGATHPVGAGFFEWWSSSDELQLRNALCEAVTFTLS